MPRHKASKLRWPKLLLVAILVYGITFLVWSRARTFSFSMEQKRVWSFFSPPAGLSMLNPTSWSKWKKNERIAATVFWPCVLLDEKLTKRRYWPARFTDAPRTFAVCEPRFILEGEISPVSRMDGDFWGRSARFL